MESEQEYERLLRSLGTTICIRNIAFHVRNGDEGVNITVKGGGTFANVKSVDIDHLDYSYHPECPVKRWFWIAEKFIEKGEKTLANKNKSRLRLFWNKMHGKYWLPADDNGDIVIGNRD